MSNLANFKEACEWLRDWEAHRWPPTSLRVIKRAAVEQRANYEACARDRRWPSSFKPEEYRRSVELIEAAIPAAELRAEERAATCTCGHRREEHKANACHGCTAEPWATEQCDGIFKTRKPIKVLGYDGGEERRAEITEDARLRYWYPLIEWGIDRDACIALIKSEGLPVPVKSACFYCPSSTKQEVIQLSIRHPDLFARAVAMEQRALAPNATGVRGERHDLQNVKGLGRHWAWKDLVEADEERRAEMVESPVEACVICNDDGCEA